ncbi:MAG: epoxyqueuosine reductase QueH [Thermoplasmatota archaeon]
MSLLIHACCAPCLTYTYEYFKEHFKGKSSVLWYNPNIHPFKEYEKRLEAMIDFQKKIDVDIIYVDEYDLEMFLDGALKAKSRCEYCYKSRLSKTAQIAKENGYDAFTTTLTISPYQDHDLIRKIGENEGKKKDVEFIYKDLTDGFYESHNLANELDLYKQGYCGCIFSEKDRYEKKIIEQKRR